MVSVFSDSGSDCGSGQFSGSVFGSGESVDGVTHLGFPAFTRERSDAGIPLRSGGGNNSTNSSSISAGHHHSRSSRCLAFEERSASEGSRYDRGLAGDLFVKETSVASSAASSSGYPRGRRGESGSGDFSLESAVSGCSDAETGSAGVTLRRPRSAGSGSVRSASSGAAAAGDAAGLRSAVFGEGGSLLSAVETAEANKRLSFQEKRQFFESL